MTIGYLYKENNISINEQQSAIVGFFADLFIKISKELLVSPQTIYNFINSHPDIEDNRPNRRIINA